MYLYEIEGELLKIIKEKNKHNQEAFNRLTKQLKQYQKGFTLDYFKNLIKDDEMEWKDYNHRIHKLLRNNIYLREELVKVNKTIKQPNTPFKSDYLEHSIEHSYNIKRVMFEIL